MNRSKTLKVSIAGLVTAALAGTTVATGPAQAAEEHGDSARQGGNRSLAAVLAQDGARFDKNWKDFDILEKAVVTVLTEKPDSPVALLTQGRKRATAFLPTDAAFRRLVRDLTGSRPANEAAAFSAVASVADVDTLESVLLYHVVPGKTLGAKKVVALEGKSVTTALGSKVKIEVKKKGVVLQDADRNDRNAVVTVTDINKGNKQIGHAINRVLRPIDL
ncbi:fasciclin domain-containing protein [Nocardioides pantholopis]|uniref:fasciclin domain-containing protein n=1 Tax=Nocardioides pantholopis TaxID=2483798 RepID=UPI000F07B651|nr:fasciclin domain-containing protein [Nocardioides pantholopis]